MPPPASRPDPRSHSRSRPAILLPLLAVVAIAALAAPHAALLTAPRDEAAWRAREEARLVAAADAIGRRASALVEELRSASVRAADALGLAGAGEAAGVETIDPRRAFEGLEQAARGARPPLIAGPPASAAAAADAAAAASAAEWGLLLESEGRDVAWWGRPLAAPSIAPRDGVFLDSGRIRTTLGVATSFSGGRRVIASVPFDVASAAPRGVEARFAPNGAAPAPGFAPDDGRASATVSFTIGGQALGALKIDGETFEGARARRRATGEAVRALLAAVVVALAAARFWRAGFGARGLAPSVAFVCGARILLALVRPPPTAFGSKLFDPEGFAGAAPLGLLRSPGDLFLTVVAFAAVVWLIDRAAGSGRRAGADADDAADASAGAATAARVVLSLVGAAAAWHLAVRLVTAAVYGAGPRLFDSALPSLTSIAIMLLIALSLAGFAIFRALVLLVRVGRAADRPFALFLPLAVLVALSVAPAATQFAGLSEAARRAVPEAPLFAAAIAAAFGLERIARRGRPAEYARGALLLFGASLAILPGVDRGIEARDRDRIAEAAARFATPRDEWRRFVLEETLEHFASRRGLAAALARGAPANPENLAFTEWAESPLASLGYECALEILDGAGAVVSRFSVGLPAESGYRATFAFRDARETKRPVVLAGRRPLGREVLDTYLGATPLLGPDSTVVGAVVITVPYFFENLAFAARPESRRPLLLGAGGPPSTGLEGRLIVSRFERGALAASSDPTIPPGRPLPDGLARSPAGRFWAGSLYGGREATLLVSLPSTSAEAVAVAPAGAAGAADEPPTPSSLAFTLRRSGPRDLAARLVHVALVGAAILVARALVGLALAALRSERRSVTFRGKLLAAFLAIAVIPALLMGALAYRQTRSRIADAAQREALEGLDAVRSLLRERSAGEATRLSETTLIRRLALGLEPPTAIDLETGLRKFSIFSAAGDLLLQNGVVPDASRDLVRRVAVTLSPETFFSPEDGLSVVSLVPIVFEGEAEPGKGVLLLRTVVDGALLAELGEEGDRDVIAYSQAGLVASNRPELFQSEILPRRMSADAYVDCFLNRREATFGTGVLAGAPYVAAYGTLVGLSGDPLGALAVPLLFRQREIDEEAGRALARILYLTAVVLVFVSFLASLVADRIARPVAEISAGTKRISRGELAFSLPRAGGGELGELVDSFNRMTEELLRSRDRLLERTRTIEAILGNMTTGVLALDPDGRITTLNRGGARILGLADGAGIGEPASWLRDGVRDGIADTLEAIGSARDGVLEREVALHRPASSMRADPLAGDPIADPLQTVRAVGTRLLDEAGEEIGRVLVFEDLTELIRTKKLMAWGEMARQVAHEIKNPLTPMKLSAQQIRSAFHDRAPQFPKILEEGTQAIIDEIESLQRIATEFSAFARMPRRLVRDEDLNEIVRESARFYGGAGGASGVGAGGVGAGEVGAGGVGVGRGASGGPNAGAGALVDVALDLATDGPRVRVDRSEMKRVLVNLIENAVQASAAGGRVVVRTLALDGKAALGAPPAGGFVAWSGRPAPSDRLAVVVVEDHGSGIASEFRARLFEPNFSTKTNGTGLGLAICKGIVEDHGGAIRVASAAGRGTTVSVIVPAVDSDS